MNVKILRTFLPLIWYYNSFILVMGLLMVIYGLYWSSYSFINNTVFIHDFVFLSSYPSLVMSLGVAKVIGSLSGYLYALTKIKYFYLLNIMVIVLILGWEIKLFIILVRLQKEMLQKIAWYLKLEVNEYFITGALNDLDEIQKDFQCCGWRNVTDFVEQYIPVTCCKEKVCTYKNSYKQPCLKLVYNQMDGFISKALLLFKMGCIIGLGCFVIVVLLYHLIYRKNKQKTSKIRKEKKLR